jgi:TonB family protein
MRIKLSIIFFLFISVLLSAQQDSNRVYMFVPQMPAFSGDLDAYLADHIQYPQSAARNKIQGTVNVTFVVTQTGAITEVAVLSGISPDIDSEAVRVVRGMPLWNPGMKDGKAVKVQYNLPVFIGPNNNSGPMERNETYRPRDTVFILRDGLYIDPYIGFGEGGPKSSTATPINMGLNMKFGVEGCYMFPSNIGISVGLQIQQFKFGYSYSNITNTSAYNGTVTENRSTANDTIVTAGYNETINYSFTYAQIPLLCHYISSQENKLGFYAEAGIVVNYLVNSQISGSVTQTQYQLTQAPDTYWYMYNSTYPTNTTSVNLPAQNPTKLTFAAHAAVGALIPFTSKISLILAVSPDFGVMNAGDGSKDLVNIGTSKFYFFGNGNYGSFNSYLFDAKLLIKMSGSSRAAVRIN